ncbi:MAG: AAA family ATPase [Pseudomonadota bacterium]
MYLEHFGLTEAPFTITPHTEFFFAGANRGATLEALIYAITQGEGIVKVSGEVGSGKTMLCRVLMERLPETVATIYLAIPSLSRDEMLAALCSDLGVKTNSSSPNTLLKALQEKLLRLHEEGKRVVALIDEAHAMPLESLEEIRLLSNLETNTSKLLQLALFGQPELDEHLAKAQMRQLRERITHSFRLSPLTLEDVQEYLRHRLRAAGYKGAEVFNAACVKIIARASEGLTRRINIIADKSLLAAYSANTHSVSPAHVKAAIRDSEFTTITPSSRTPWFIGAALASGLALGVIGTGWIMNRNASAEPQTSLPTAPVAMAANSQEASRTATLGGNPAQSGITSVKADSPQAQAFQSQNIAAVAPLTLPERLTAAQNWLSQETPSHWIVQLLTANSNETNQLLDFIRESEQTLGANRVHAYGLTINGTQKINVVYGGFESRAEAQKAIAALPPSLRQFKPYLRTVQLIRNENKSALQKSLEKTGS